MDKTQHRADASAFMRASQMQLPTSSDDALPRMSRERVPPPLDTARARQACAPMGTLHSIVVTVNPNKRRRTWYVVEPDFAMAEQYAAAGLDLTPNHSRTQDVRIAMSNSFGFGGQNTAIIFRRWTE